MDCDFQAIGTQNFEVDGRKFIVDVIDSAKNYVDLMKTIFDFPKLRGLIRGTESRQPFNVLIDSMNGVTGVYVQKIFLEEIGALQDNVRRIIPLDNFGEIHPDPNLTYAKDLVDKVKEDGYDFGTAFDGDGVNKFIYKISKNITIFFRTVT